MYRLSDKFLTKQLTHENVVQTSQPPHHLSFPDCDSRLWSKCEVGVALRWINTKLHEVHPDSFAMSDSSGH
jgi:hypothetical protein